jgi:hypothetical protein
VLDITATCSSIGPELYRPLQSIHGMLVLCPYQKDERAQFGNRQKPNIFYNTPCKKLVSLSTNVPIFSSLSLCLSTSSSLCPRQMFSRTFWKTSKYLTSFRFVFFTQQYRLLAVHLKKLSVIIHRIDGRWPSKNMGHSRIPIGTTKHKKVQKNLSRCQFILQPM